MIFDPRQLIHGLELGDSRSLVSVFFLLIFNEIGLPLPIVYETILLYAGFKLSRGQTGFLTTAVFGAFGSMVGASLVFIIFYIFGDRILKSRFLRSHLNKVQALKNELGKREILAVAFGRLTPGLINLAGAAAGVLHLNYFKFILGVLLSNLVWAAVMMTAGFFFGEASVYLSGKLATLLGLISLLVFLFIFKRILAKLKSYA